jgi:hypothetical protein
MIGSEVSLMIQGCLLLFFPPVSGSVSAVPVSVIECVRVLLSIVGSMGVMWFTQGKIEDFSFMINYVLIKVGFHQERFRIASNG